MKIDLATVVSDPPAARTDEEWALELERRAAETRDPNWRGRTWEQVRAEVEHTLRVRRLHPR